jgi:dipeptidase
MRGGTMKKLLIVVAGLCLALSVVVAAAAVPHKGAAAPRSAVASGQTAARDHWCNFVLAGKNATTDGSVMMGYNNDWSANNYQYLQVVPATASTYRVVKILTMGGIQEGGLNEYQLGVNYGTATDLDPAVLAADPYAKKGYGGEMWDLILQQCSTAQQALTLLQTMANTKGFSAGAAGSFGFGDANEVWLFELLGGHHWVAQRVPDNAFLAHPNMLTVRQVNLADTANFRGSSDLQSFAQSIGRYDPASGPFDVAWAYGDRTELRSYYNTNRLWGAYHLVAPSLTLTPTMPYATRPVYVVPDHKLTRQDIMAIDRYHYESTALDQTQGYALMSPHAQTDRPICYSTTDYGTAWQMRSSLPAAVGGVVWIAPSRPCSSAFVPFYAGITSVPAAWTGKTAYTAFRAVADSLDKNGTVGGQIRYKYYSPLVRSTYGAFETEVASAQAATETTAKGLTGTAQTTYLTNYSAQRATQAYNLALSLPAKMP